MSKEKTFLYEEIHNAIKEKILSGEYGKGMLLPSENEFCSIYHVNRITIRKALLMLVNEQLVKKIPGIGTKVIHETTKPVSQQPRNEKKLQDRQQASRGTIGFFIPTSTHKKDRISQPFYSEMFYFAEKEFHSKGYSFYYSALEGTDTLADILEGRHLSGIILLSNIDEKAIQTTLEKKIPTVLINAYHPRLCSILADNIYGMKDICEYIIRQGHKKIALLSGITSYIATQERLLGCHYAFSEHQVPEPTIIETDWETETAYDKTLELFSSGKSHPTAIIAFNDSLALGAMQAVNKLGMSVPKDVSIVGFDGLDQDRYSMPALTTVNTNIPLMAKLAARNLDFTIQHPEQPNNVRIIVPHEISYRDSVSPELS